MKNMKEYIHQQSVPVFIQQLENNDIKTELDKRKKAVENILAEDKKEQLTAERKALLEARGKVQSAIVTTNFHRLR